MFEKVNPNHPDKVADRIAGAIVDLAYSIKDEPKIAVEVLIGHDNCRIAIESDVRELRQDKCRQAIFDIVNRIVGYDGISRNVATEVIFAEQDKELAKNQSKEARCGDNGIFKGCYISKEEELLTELAQDIYKVFGTDGKYILDLGKRTSERATSLIVCQSHAKKENLMSVIDDFLEANELKIERVVVNPLGEWTGGINVDTGATNRKLGSDMGRAITGGGLMAKDLSKADVSVNIVCHLLAQKEKQTITALCAIGDNSITFTYEDGRILANMQYSTVVDKAQRYIKKLGGFEKLAEWGLIR